MTKWRACAARTVGLSFLNSISKGLVLYRTDYGQSPDHLRRLETAGLVGGKERSVPTENDTRIFEQTEYTYFPLPDSAPGDLLRVFDWPVHHNDEGACVLYVNGQARWVPTAQFVVDLDKTYRWRLAQSAPAATSAE